MHICFSFALYSITIIYDPYFYPFILTDLYPFLNLAGINMIIFFFREHIRFCDSKLDTEMVNPYPIPIWSVCAPACDEAYHAQRSLSQVRLNSLFPAIKLEPDLLFILYWL